MPSSVSGSECGGIGWPGQPRRLPEDDDRGERRDTGVDVHDRAAGEVERAPLEQPARRRSTQCATGEYTRIDHSAMKPTHAANLMRSAIAPVISAGVMIANVSWNATNASGGIGEPPNVPTASGPVMSLQSDEVEVPDPAAVAEVAEGERVAERHPEHA